MKKTLINTICKIALVLVPTLTLSMTAAAHDPKLHAKKPVTADCSKMDHSKMDMKDPVAMAMMKKCMNQAKATSDKMDEKMDEKMDDKDMKKEEHNNH